MKANFKKVLQGHSGPIYCLCVDSEGNRLLSGSSDRMVGAWNLEELAPDGFSIRLEATVFSLCQMDNVLFIGQGEGGVHVIDLLTKKELRHLKYHSLPVFQISANVDNGHLYFLGGDGILSIVDGTDFSLLWSLPLSKDKLRSAILDSADRKLLIGSSDGSIRILETDYYNVIQEITAHEGGVYDMRWISGDSLVTVGRDGHIRIWDYIQEKLSERKAIPAHNYAIYSIDFSPSKEFFATASRDKSVKIWDLKDLHHPFKIVRKGPVGHSHSVNVVRWLSDHSLVSAGDDRKLFFWSISNS